MNSPTPPPILRLDGVGFAYPGQPALASGWSASVGEGVTLLHGDTGSGKSTLLRVIAGTLPASGTLALAGASLAAAPDAYRRQVFFCDPATEAFDQVTARDCTAMLGEGDGAFDAALWQTLVEGFSLTAHIDKPMYMLSTGSKRKVWLPPRCLRAGRWCSWTNPKARSMRGRSAACGRPSNRSRRGRAMRSSLRAARASATCRRSGSPAASSCRFAERRMRRVASYLPQMRL